MNKKEGFIVGLAAGIGGIIMALIVISVIWGIYVAIKNGVDF